MTTKYWLPVAASLLLGACGGSGGGGDSSVGDPTSTRDAVINNIDDAKRQLAALVGIAGLGDISGDGVFLKKSVSAKVAQTFECDEGSYTENEETGRTEYDNCRYSFSTFSELLDGVILDQCADGRSALINECDGAFRFELGEGNSLFLSRFTDTQSGSDLQFRARATFEDTETFGNNSERYQGTANGRLLVQDFGEGRAEVEFVFQNLSTDETYFYDDLSTTLSINGSFGTNAGEAFGNCGSGRVTIETNQAIVFDSEDITRSGQVTLRGANNTSASILFNDDGSFTVMVNGQTQTIEDFSGFCQ